MKKLTLLVLVALALTAMACAPAPTPVPTQAPPTAAPVATQAPAATKAPAASNEPYKIGLIISLTGPVAAPGGEIRDGATLEVEKINAAGGVNGHPLQLIIEDDGSDTTKGVAGATKLIRQDGVLALMGPLSGDLATPLAQLAEKEKVTIITTSPSTADAVNSKWQNYRYQFSVVPAHNLIAAATLQAIKLQGYKKVVVMGDALNPMPAAVDAMVKQAPAMGVQVVVVSDTWTNQDMDLSPQATKAKDAVAREKADALVLLTNGISGVAFLKGMQQVGLKTPVIGAPPWGMGAIFAMGGDMVNGVVFPASKIFEPQALPDNDPQKPVALDFVKRMNAKYNYPVGQFPAMGADAVNLLAGALKTSGGDRAALRDTLEKTKGFVGLAGVFSYGPEDHEGLTVDTQAIYQIKDKQFKMLSVVQK